MLILLGVGGWEDNINRGGGGERGTKRQYLRAWVTLLIMVVMDGGCWVGGYEGRMVRWVECLVVNIILWYRLSIVISTV